MKMFLIGLAAALLSTAALAGSIDQVNNTVSVDVGTSYLNYTETYNGVPKDSEKGTVATLGFSVIKELGDVYASVEGSRSDGNVQYTGGNVYTGQAIGFRHEVRTYDIDGKLGFALIKNDNVQVTPYASIAYHHWYRPLNAYDNEVYTNYADGLGVIGQFASGPWVTTVDVGVNDTFHAQNVESGLAVYVRSGGQTAQTSYYLGGRVGETASVKVSRLLGKHSVFAQLGVNRSQYGVSAVNSFGFLEPDSTTVTTNLTVGFAF